MAPFAKLLTLTFVVWFLATTLSFVAAVAGIALVGKLTDSGLAGVWISPGVRRQIGPMFITKMWPVCGLNPILNSPWLLSADEPVGAMNVW